MINGTKYKNKREKRVKMKTQADTTALNTHDMQHE
jgi:hypothetical protein